MSDTTKSEKKRVKEKTMMTMRRKPVLSSRLMCTRQTIVLNLHLLYSFHFLKTLKGDLLVEHFVKGKKERFVSENINHC